MNKKLLQVMTSAKYLYSLILIFLLFFRDLREDVYLLQNLELVAIFFIFDYFSRKSVKVTSVISFIVMFFFNAQLLLKFFAHGYLSMIMLTNITLVQDISGKASVYIINIIIMVIFSLLPVFPLLPLEKINLPKRVIYIMPVVLSIGISTLFGGNKAPIYSYGYLARDAKLSHDDERHIKELENLIANTNEETNNKDDSGIDPYVLSLFEEFHKDNVESFWEEQVFDTAPNVIYIMVEGLSKSVLLDERGIMKNAKDYMDKSVEFIDYYDHTVATYRGIIGQLYSGHQFLNTEDNRLVSIMDVLRDEGYHSTFINAEPNIEEFTDYLKNLGFDETISEEDDYEGIVPGSMSDKEVFLRLKKAIEDRAKEDAPFFISTYFFGTHVNIDSPHEKYGDGSSMTLNKFYNLDKWFGEFMEWFDDSDITDNTLFVFTADHASFRDNEWDPSFPVAPRLDAWIDEIPMFYYYKGVSPLKVECNGRNSINSIPTLIDYLNIGEDHENFFLGDSLFNKNSDNPLGTVFYSNDYTRIVDTKDGEFRDIESVELDELRQKIKRYFTLKRLWDN